MTTADVDTIARDLMREIDCCYDVPCLNEAQAISDIRTALTQACAPLEKRIGILERAIERRNIALDDANKRNRELVQARAPTADCEKIARAAVIKLQDSCIQLDPRIAITVMREALAQARAPLVEALEFIANDLSFTSLNTARSVARCTNQNRDPKCKIHN